MTAGGAAVAGDDDARGRTPASARRLKTAGPRTTTSLNPQSIVSSGKDKSTMLARSTLRTTRNLRVIRNARFNSTTAAKSGGGSGALAGGLAGGLVAVGVGYGKRTYPTTDANRRD